MPTETLAQAQKSYETSPACAAWLCRCSSRQLAWASAEQREDEDPVRVSGIHAALITQMHRVARRTSMPMPSSLASAMRRKAVEGLKMTAPMCSRKPLAGSMYSASHWPPTPALRSRSATLLLRRVSASAAAMPAGPAPTTHTSRYSSAAAAAPRLTACWGGAANSGAGAGACAAAAAAQASSSATARQAARTERVCAMSAAAMCARRVELCVCSLGHAPCLLVLVLVLAALRLSASPLHTHAERTRVRAQRTASASVTYHTPIRACAHVCMRSAHRTTALARASISLFPSRVAVLLRRLLLVARGGRRRGRLRRGARVHIRLGRPAALLARRSRLWRHERRLGR
jgi:hypothetical protein